MIFPWSMNNFFNKNLKNKYTYMPTKKTESQNSTNTNSKTPTDNTISDSSPMFELLGIQFHDDDILLLSLIFFLYSEGVEDKWLFVALILLLLS